MHDLLDDPDPAVRQAAALAVIPLLEDLSLAPHRPASLQRVNTILSSSTGPGHHASATRAALLPDGPTVPVDGGFDDDPPI
ncbi:hypothetical protein ACRYCC_42675 [Actinomadura scrupuli]|uniref:hypothetical protein n=1 Tax=Actinomadura scrupuli TaxID=559629 RepID=UPI003D973579